MEGDIFLKAVRFNWDKLEYLAKPTAKAKTSPPTTTNQSVSQVWYKTEVWTWVLQPWYMLLQFTHKDCSSYTYKYEENANPEYEQIIC